MMQGINRSAAGLVLSAFIGTLCPVPVMSQTASMQASSQETNSLQSASSPLVNAAYTLGPGDVLRIDSYDTPDLVLEPRYTVLLDGAVNLPWVGSVSVKGLTLKQASDRLKEKYSDFIKNPTITVGLLAARTLKIGVIGEVNRPGSYIIASNLVSSAAVNTQQNSPQNNLVGQQAAGDSGSQWPTVSKAIQAAGGITEQANIRQIQVHRPTNSGKDDVINIDLWKFLDSGDLAQDIPVRDGDTVVIPKADKLDPAEVTQVASSNFSPDVIKVNVVGEVAAPGAVAVKPNTTLNQAILAAGGFKAGRAKNNVDLIRLNPNGTVEKRSISVDFAQKLDDKTNPPLRNNDVVVVHRNGFAGVTDTLGNLLGPLGGLFGIFSIFR